MLANLATAEPDPLWALINSFRADPRPYKIDLVVGVYRDASGKTPVMKSVRDAEIFLASTAPSKSYRALSGNGGFNDGMANLVLGAASDALTRQCTIQTVGGTGALRVLADFIAIASPNTTVWNTDPGYVNHRPIIMAAGLPVKTFRWVENDTGLDLESALSDLAAAKEGDVVIFHGCCHNPTGIDPSFEQWRMLVEFCKRKCLIPLIDIAYQGFGDGMDEDVAGTRLFVRELNTVLVAASCSKNMGLYCERTGAAMIIAPDAGQLGNIRSTLERITRVSYSMPPEHGAAVAAELFQNQAQWRTELEECRSRITDVRQALGEALLKCGAPDQLQALCRQKGMFSLLPLTGRQMATLRFEYAIYGTASGRINIAGLMPDQIDTLAYALKTVSDEGPQLRTPS